MATIMLSRRHQKYLLATVLLGLAVGPLSGQDTSHRGRKYKAPPPTSRVDVTILRNDDGRPIENAAVVFQLEGDKGNMELKTNEDGKTMIDVLPTGSKVLLQVIAKGFQTFGGDYSIDKSEMAISVKLKRPGQQYSIYEEHPQSADSGKSTDKQDDGKKDDSKGSSKNPSQDSSDSSTAKPDDSQSKPQ
jgi:hypothetical protein